MDQREGNQGRRPQGPPPRRQARSQPYAGSRGSKKSRSQDEEFAREKPQRKRPQRSGEKLSGKATRAASAAKDSARRIYDDRDKPMFDASNESLHERYEKRNPHMSTPRKSDPAPNRGLDPRSKKIIIVVAIIVAVLIIIGIAKCAGGGSTGGKDKAKDTAKTEQAAENGEATPTGVESPWTESGYFSSGDATFDARLKDYCDQHTPEDGKAEDGARAMYDVIVAMDHEITETNQNPGGPGWELTYAKQILDANSGNNYEKAALIAQMLKYFGYDATAQPCIVDGESAGLVIVTTAEGEQLICSPALESAGWMLPASSVHYQIDNDVSTSSPSSDEDSDDSSEDYDEDDGEY